MISDTQLFVINNVGGFLIFIGLALLSVLSKISRLKFSLKLNGKI